MPLTSLRWRSGDESCSWFQAGMSTVQYALPPDRATKMCGMCPVSVCARSSSTPSKAPSPLTAGSGDHISDQPAPGPATGGGGGVAGGALVLALGWALALGLGLGEPLAPGLRDPSGPAEVPPGEPAAPGAGRWVP